MKIEVPNLSAVWITFITKVVERFQKNLKGYELAIVSSNSFRFFGKKDDKESLSVTVGFFQKYPTLMYINFSNESVKRMDTVVITFSKINQVGLFKTIKRFLDFGDILENNELIVMADYYMHVDSSFLERSEQNIVQKDTLPADFDFYEELKRL